MGMSNGVALGDDAGLAGKLDKARGEGESRSVGVAVLLGRLVAAAVSGEKGL